MKIAPGVDLLGSASFDETVLFPPVSLEIDAGGWSCLLGPSGCGKTTILRLIAGLDTGAAFEGRISASDGAPIPDRVAYMAQTDLLMPWLDVLGNVTLGARLRGEAPDQDAARALVTRLGLEPHLHKRPSQLSGGQRQRVALARTLMEDRPIVLLDEPFSALDARTRADMQDLAAETLSGRTVLLVTHDPGEAARLGDRVFLLDEGGMMEAVPPATPTVRPVDDPNTLAFQARLLTALREGHQWKA
ncbi:putative hydroxymethylpyrimidine transport system ATP-binding protein [Aliiruegeria haliotis]|uniref:Putative hydroxymethylpyrimidine transport system ATP-binding protein n=1 Tax=Aliiruegeria haliotis TaxID=1280846 RepID=A0A2T0RWC3_9RHOB|nr:ABC transporter ATP-binding protein [Aliiruegeria haliotis]PRY25447.1 putative hydroxymethylpyrimidine transport system ATP-binding protein [Aliiruegeria haliotis]